MRRRGQVVEEKQHRELTIALDPVNEQVVLAAALVDAVTRVLLTRRLQPDHFLVEHHKVAWSIVIEMVRQGLDYDPATFQVLAAGRIDTAYVVGLAEIRPDVPPNLEHHVQLVLWDRQRASAAQGPVSSLLEALKDPLEVPERVRALARQVAGAFDGAGERRFLHDRKALVCDHMAEVRRRVNGHACFPYGVEGLDKHADGSTRMLPGAMPGQVTVVTGTPGSGKSVFTAHLALALSQQKRRVCFGAWEMGGGMSLELLACISLRWSRTDLIEGRLTEDELAVLEERMLEIGKYVTFMGNPFRRVARERGSNDKNLDLLQGILADSGCDVFIADLWKRCLREADPEGEEDALMRQQAMAVELGQHHVLVHQQRSKDIMQRTDKRPTAEGIKGSSALFEIADTMFGTYRPAQWKQIADDKFQLFVLKQRYGKWPLAVEFDWDAERGQIWGGVGIDYQHPGEAGALEDGGLNKQVFKKPRSEHARGK